MRPQAQPPYKKTYAKEIFDSMMVTTTISTFVAFPIGVYAYIFIGDMIAKELGCENFINVLFDVPGCDDLKKIAILNGGAVWAEGDIFTNFTILSSFFGLLLGTGRWFLNRNNGTRGTVAAVVSTDLDCYGETVCESYGERVNSELNKSLLKYERHPPSVSDMRAEFLDSGEEEVLTMVNPIRVVQTDWVSSIKRVSDNAWFSSRITMLVAALMGLPSMFRASNAIFKDFSCTANLFDLVLFADYEHDKCGAPPLYWGMTAFAYPWAFATWTGGIVLELAIIYQLLPKAAQNYFSKPFRALYHCLRLDKLTSDPQYRQDLLSHISFAVKLIGLLVLIGFAYPVLADGFNFSNKVLAQSGCLMSLFDILFSSKLDLDSPACTPLMQILGMDSFPTKTEIYFMMPLAAITVTFSSVVGAVIGAGSIKYANYSDSQNSVGARNQNINALRQKLDDYNQKVDKIYNTGFYSSLAFIPISTWGILSYAIPKANQLLDLHGCSDLHFPLFISAPFLHDFSDSACSILDLYRANAAYISTMWIIFSYSALICGVGGMGIHTLYSAVKEGCQMASDMVSGCRDAVSSVGSRFFSFFRPADDGNRQVHYQQLPDEDTAYAVV